MQLHPRVTRSTLDFVRPFEGYRRTAARLPGGGWTVGHGHTLTAREGAVVEREDARALLAYDLSRTAFALEPLIFAPLDPAAFDALVSLAFSIGVPAFAGSEVLRRLNAGAPLQAAAGFDHWRSAELNGRVQVIDALVRRRAAEKALFLTPLAGYPAAPSPVLRAQADAPAGTPADDGAAVSERDAEPSPPPLMAPVAHAHAPLEGRDAAAVALGSESLASPAPDLRTTALDALAARLDRVIPERAPPIDAPPIEAPPVTAHDFVAPPVAPFPAAETPPKVAAAPPPMESAVAPAWTPEPADAVPGVVAPPKPPRRWRAALNDTLVYAAIALLGAGLLFVSVVSALDRPKLGFFLLGAVGILAMIPAAFRAVSGPQKRARRTSPRRASRDNPRR